jgi:hypothetical protein
MSVMGDTNVTCTFDPWPGYSVRGNHQEDGFSFQHPYLWWESNATPGDPTGGMLRRQADGGTMYITTTNGTPFTPVDFFLAEWDSNPTPGTLTLIGTRADGSTVTASYGMSGAWVDYQFGLTFANIVTLQTDANMIMLDNFTATVVPEPGTGVLCLLGVAAIFLPLRKLRQTAT